MGHIRSSQRSSRGARTTRHSVALSNRKRNFFGWNAADFGWGGDRIQNILWRLSNGELENLNPKIVVLQAGTNNIAAARPGLEDAMVEDVTRGLQAVVEAIRRKAPEATIILTGIFPRNDNMALMPLIHEVNSNLAKFADGAKVRFLNINDKLASPEGRLFDGMLNADKLHPTERAYQVWADALKPVFREILGPPGAEDYAPPPTGDPGAQR